MHTCFLQLVEIMPCLDKLPELLGRPYGFDDDDAEHAAGQGADDMDMDGPGAVAAAGPGSTAQQQQGPFTLEQLLQRVQVRRQQQAQWWRARVCVGGAVLLEQDPMLVDATATQRQCAG